jgi:hypothetical protein
MDEYAVTINGIEHRMMLSEEDAERYGDAAQKVKGDKPETKARTATSNKARQ